MKNVKISKILSLVLAAGFAFLVFASTAEAATPLDAQRRPLTKEEIATIAKAFNGEDYAKMYPDVVKAFGTNDPMVMYNHFINCGIWENRQPNAQFEVNAYATKNVDLHKAYGPNVIAYYLHYANHPEERAGRGIATLGDAANRHAAVYYAYDFVVGQEQPRAGAMKLQTENYRPTDSMSDNEIISKLNDEGLLDAYLKSLGK